jgi:hypothetical protein
MRPAASFVDLIQNISLPARGKADGCDAAHQPASVENAPITRVTLA